MTTDLSVDDDSIQVVAFFSYEGTASNSLGWRLDYGDAYLEGTTDIAVSTDTVFPLVSILYLLEYY